jgi:PBP1b-binding outer membrane lipoprotein LpoB
VILVILASLFLAGCSPETKQEEEWETKYPDVPTTGVTDPNWGKF